MKKIGLTTTVPIEVLLAAKYQPVDLNNLFITSQEYESYIELAERDGFPKSFCAWIKGIYGACIKNNIKEIVGVMGGDCSNTKVFIEILAMRGIQVYPFCFPQCHQIEEVTVEIKKLMELFHVTLEEVEEVRRKLMKIRTLAKRLDQLTYEKYQVSGFENHLYQVSLSDFNGDCDMMEKTLTEFLTLAEQRPSNGKNIRLGYLGVPPMTADLYEFVEKFDACIVYNEVQREFAFPRGENASDIFQQYYDYTYPYDIFFRIEELQKQIRERKLDGILHYTQAFCYRAAEHIVLREKLDIPILNIEGDKQNTLDARTKLRLEAFLDMLGDLKGGPVR